MLFIGALGDRRKGFDTLHKAWEMLTRRSATDPLLVVIGQGALLPEWQQRTRAAGLERSITYLGFRNDVPRLVRAADMLVAPTRYEAYGLGVHEALCCGLPAVVSADAGVAERYPAELADLPAARRRGCVGSRPTHRHVPVEPPRRHEGDGRLFGAPASALLGRHGEGHRRHGVSAMTRHRVLYVMPNAVPGGAERATMLMLASHDRDRYEPGVLFFSDGPLVGDARSLGLDVHVLPRKVRLSRPWSVRTAIAEGCRIVSDGGFSLVHSCMAYAHLIGGAIAWQSGVPGVLYQHGPLGAWMDSAATLLRCDRILVNSAFTAASSARTPGAPVRSRWRHMASTCRATHGQERADLQAEVNARHGIPPDAPVIGLMARFDPWKGIDVALRAAAPLLRSRPELRFIVVERQYRHFHPEYGPLLRALVESEGIDHQVIFAGFQMDVRAYLARMTVLVHSSLQPEPFGLTIIEAMAAGVPVVAAQGGGAAEIIESGVDGLFHSPGNELELRAALQMLLDDASLRDSFAYAGLLKVEKQYRPSHMMRVVEGVVRPAPRDGCNLTVRRSTGDGTRA